jgi:8-oxo-dGTP pyrophosphatase MutT (NUDIX family)
MTTELSAGGVVYKREGKDTLWLLVKHSGYHKWVFPKGRQEKGEELSTTAVREVKEESGVVAKIIAPIAEQEKYIYTFNGERISKTVQYYLMECVGGETTDHDFETEEVRWMDIEEAQELLGFPAAKKTLLAAEHLLNSLA